jgi:cobalt-zinc-cadmium efflux system protein
MKSEKNILWAFLLKLFFSAFQITGGLITGSAAILSDAIHDVGDAASVGISYFLERMSKHQPDERYTFGYARYSVIGGMVASLILLVGSAALGYGAVGRLFEPAEIHYDGMIVFALVGVGVNLCAAFFTRHGHSLNQKAVNIHMLEDVMAWLIVLVGAVIMRFTDLAILDPIMSICVAVFIFVNALRNLLSALGLLLEKAPSYVNVGELREHVLAIEGVEDVHHFHIWSLDAQINYATVHLVTEGDQQQIKHLVREEFAKHGIGHVTVEFEHHGEDCHEHHCHVEFEEYSGHHHHHHHHH